MFWFVIFFVSNSSAHRSYISWCWIKNGIQSIKIIISALSVPFTTGIGLLNQKYGKWLGWLLSPFLAFPPGKEPTATDWICFAIYAPYSLWLLAFIGYLFYIFIWPLIAWLAAAIVGFMAMYATFEISDEARIAYMRQTDMLFYRTSVDPQTNLSIAARRPLPPPSIRPATGAEHLPTGDAATNILGGAGGGGGNVVTGNAPPVQKVGSRFRRSTPYEAEAEPSEADVRRMMQDHSSHALSVLESALIEAAAELGMPVRAAAYENHASWLRKLWGRACGAYITHEYLQQFERTHSPLLLSYQFSPYWMYQFINYQRKKRKINTHYAPVRGEYKRGVTDYCKYDITTRRPSRDARREADPQDVV